MTTTNFVNRCIRYSLLFCLGLNFVAVAQTTTKTQKPAVVVKKTTPTSSKATATAPKKATVATPKKTTVVAPKKTTPVAAKPTVAKPVTPTNKSAPIYKGTPKPAGTFKTAAPEPDNITLPADYDAKVTKAPTTKPAPAKPSTTPATTKPSTAKTASTASKPTKATINDEEITYPTLPGDVKVISKSPTGVMVTNADLPTLTNYERDRLIKIQRLIRTSSYLDQFSGVVIVAKDFVPIYKHAGGYANLDYNIYNALEGKFNTCRITEAFTAVAIMQLAEKGKIDLQTPVKNYLTNIKTDIGNLTVHQLLTHTTGLPNYYTNMEYVNNFFNIKDINEMLELIIDQTKKTNTTAHANTPSDYVILAAIIENITQKDYRDYITDNILKPSQMNFSDLYSWNEVIESNAVGYSFTSRDSLNQKRTVVKRKRTVDKNQEAYQTAEYWGAYPFGADGIYTTAEDLLKFMKNLLDNKLLSKKYTDTLFNNYSIENINAQNTLSQYGYGFLTKTVKGQKVQTQGGTLDALSVQMRHYTDDNYTIIVFSNYYTNRAEDIADKIERSIYDNEYIVPTEPIGFVFNQYIEQEGLVYVSNNFDEILLRNNIKLDKYYPLNKLSESYMQVGETLTALELLKLNLRRFPNEPMVFDAIGECYLQMKQYDQAIDWFRKKLTLLPTDQRAKGMIEYINKLKS